MLFLHLLRVVEVHTVNLTVLSATRCWPEYSRETVKEGSFLRECIFQQEETVVNKSAMKA